MILMILMSGSTFNRLMIIIVGTDKGVRQKLVLSISAGWWTSMCQILWGSLGAMVLTHSHILPLFLIKNSISPIFTHIYHVFTIVFRAFTLFTIDFPHFTPFLSHGLRRQSPAIWCGVCQEVLLGLQVFIAEVVGSLGQQAATCRG